MAQPFVSLLDRVGHWSASEVEAYQVEQLRLLLVHCARHVPYYHQLFGETSLDPTQFSRLEQLSQYPLLTKTLVWGNTHELTAASSSVGGVSWARLLDELTGFLSGISYRADPLLLVHSSMDRLTEDCLRLSPKGLGLVT